MLKSLLGLGFSLKIPVGASSVPHGLTAVTNLVTILTAWLGKVEKPPQEEGSQILVG